MLSEICALIRQNKNLVMLITVGIYILSLFSVLSGQFILFSLIISAIFIFFILKNCFPIKYIAVWVLIFYLGAINTYARLRDTDDLLNLAPINSEISGRIVSIPQGMAENKPKFFFEVNKIKFGSIEKEPKNEKVLVTINSFPDKPVDFSCLKIYNSYSLTGRLSMPFKAGNPSQFDYGQYLRNHNTYAVFYANEVKPINQPLSLKAKFMQGVNNYRERIIEIHSKYLKSPDLEILGGIVFGDDAVSPPQNIKQSFINSGLLHILAASGMNVAFIYGFFFMIMSVFKIPFKLRVSSGMLMVIIYSLMTGLGASVIRATCMLLFVLAGKLIDRDAHSISLLSFVALLMLLFNPLWINDVGFQLSFIVTLGILVMAPAFGKLKNKFADFILSAVTIPVIAQLWVIPIQIFYFNNISLYSVFANIMSVPILMVLSFGGFISSLLSAIKPIADYICMAFDYILKPLIEILVNLSDFWGKLPHSTLQTTHPNIFQLILYYGILLCISGILYKELREKYIKQFSLAFCILTTVLLLTLIPIKNNNTEITAFDVGNADCFLIKTPENEYIMIDTGKSGYNGGKSQAEIIMLKYFKDIGIKKLNSVIITHFDNDHCGGAVDLIKNLKVKKVYVNDLNHSSKAAKEIYAAAKEYNTEIVLAVNKEVIYDKDGFKITNFINPTNKSDNDNSIISFVKYNNFSMLFTGDAGTKSIKEMLNNLSENITVFKVPHHGAVGVADKEIVKTLKPEYSVISTGENKFGHPSVYTLEILKDTKILRTDVNNSIRFIINKDKLQVCTYDINAGKYKELK